MIWGLPAKIVRIRTESKDRVGLRRSTCQAVRDAWHSASTGIEPESAERN